MLVFVAFSVLLWDFGLDFFLLVFLCSFFLHLSYWFELGFVLFVLAFLFIVPLLQISLVVILAFVLYFSVLFLLFFWFL